MQVLESDTLLKGFDLQEIFAILTSCTQQDIVSKSFVILCEL